MTATYRLQLHPGFRFEDVEALIPYFRRLGISHLYLSPITEARPESTHGYDVVNHNEVREELGGREAFDRLAAAAHAEGLSLLIDFVPNHAGVGPHNTYWQDVLAYGPDSPFAAYFDIDWNPIKPELQGKVLLPFLGDPYGEVLERGELKIAYDEGRFYATYFDNRYALSPLSYPTILGAALGAFERNAAYFDLKDLRDAYQRLGARQREKAETLRPRLVHVLEKIDLSQVLEKLSNETVHEVLETQFWRLSYWKTAGYEINYRRFFDINGLVALRMEDDEVFWDAHRLLGELLALDGVEGVRIDHVDGLFDPHAYLERLRDLGAPLVWVEKILAPGETLPEAWPVQGTTGYEFMNDVMGVLVNSGGRLPLERTYRRLVPDARSYADIVYQSKKLVMGTSLSSELFRLSYELDRISEADYHTRDFTLEALREALAEVVAVFDRYRTYLPYERESAREVVRLAIQRARQRNPALEPSVFEFIERVINGDVREDLLPMQQAWVGRFQQYTAPVAAKGVEDTAFYRYFLLAALNEVGGEPDEFGHSVQAFHSHARFRAHRYPLNLLATATHDHKRGEDTRMRMIALAEHPDEWEETVHRLTEIAEEYTRLGGPSPADACLFYQTLVALWQPPSSDQMSDQAREAYYTELPDRLWTYLQKASRESKERTSWIHPDADYEAAFERFVREMLEDPRTGEAVTALAKVLARDGFQNSLVQLILKSTVPGVPDFYQGCELLDLSLVDPDNRRPVDFEHRMRLLDTSDELGDEAGNRLAEWIEAQDERAKFVLTHRLLQLRRQHPSLFTGDYQQLTPEGGSADHWIAFARLGTGADGRRLALVVGVPRFPAAEGTSDGARLPLPQGFAETSWTELLTGETAPAAEHLDLGGGRVPWLLLLGGDGPGGSGG